MFLIETAAGPARVTLSVPEGATALVALGHGAGGGVEAPDLVAAAGALVAAGCAVGLVEQPYRVAGRRAPAPARVLDAAWLTVMAELSGRLPGRPLLCGGRSSGARVACRTALEAGAVGVVALAFPLRPPGRPEADRSGELLAAGVPTLVVQGSRDPFGSADQVRAAVPARGAIEVVEVTAGDHSFRTRRVDGRTTAECVQQVAMTVADWVARRVAQGSTET